MTTISDTTENRSSEAGAALGVTFHKAAADYADAYENLAWEALDTLWNEDTALLGSGLKDFYSFKNLALRGAVNQVCYHLNHINFGHLLFICLEDASYKSIRYSDEEMLAIDDLRRLLTNDRVEDSALLSARRLLELMGSSAIDPLFSAFTHFPKSWMSSFLESIREVDVVWRETEVRFETPWLVHDKLVEQEWNPFVFVEVTGTAHAIGTFVVNSLLKSTWCAGYDDISTPTAENMVRFNEPF